ncbi:MAG: hypothetical protein ACTS3F_11685 [Phycisphaerales bacterium]
MSGSARRNPRRSRRGARRRRGVALAAVCIVIVMVNAAVVHAVTGSTDDRGVVAWRAQTVRAFFAAESGIAIVRGELGAGRIPGEGVLALEPGVTVHIERSDDAPPMDLAATGAAGIAWRRVVVRLE